MITLVYIVVATFMYKLRYMIVKRRQINKIKRGTLRPNAMSCRSLVSSDSVNQVIFNNAVLSLGLGPLDCDNKLWPIVQIEQ